jgi:protein TonB
MSAFRASSLQCAAGIAIFAALASCTITSPPGEKVAREPAAPEAVSPPSVIASVSPRPTVTPPSNAATLAEYQREFAERIHAASADQVFDGRPPNPLRAIIVYRAEVDADGRPVRVQLYRSPGARELEERAAASVLRAAPFPRPRPELLRDGGRLALIETWLFDYQGRFRLRTLALPQAAD